jgi:hypothetical protein
LFNRAIGGFIAGSRLYSLNYKRITKQRLKLVASLVLRALNSKIAYYKFESSKDYETS